LEGKSKENEQDWNWNIRNPTRGNGIVLEIPETYHISQPTVLEYVYGPLLRGSSRASKGPSIPAHVTGAQSCISWTYLKSLGKTGANTLTEYLDFFLPGD
jgi:hypothetical protein